LQQGFAAGENNKPVRFSSDPGALDGPGKRFGVSKAAAACAVHADEIGVAKAANGEATISFLAGPEIAAGKAAKYGGAPGVGSFALQREVDFLHRIFAHARPSPPNIDKSNIVLPRELATCNNKKGPRARPFCLTRHDCNGQIASVIHFFNSFFGAAPTFEEAILPSLNSISVGILRMP